MSVFFIFFFLLAVKLARYFVFFNSDWDCCRRFEVGDCATCKDKTCIRVYKMGSAIIQLSFSDCQISAALIFFFLLFIFESE